MTETHAYKSNAGLNVITYILNREPGQQAEDSDEAID